MKDKNLRLPMPLFEPRSPDWNTLSAQARQRVIDVLSQLLRDAVDHQRELTTTTKTQEDVHVS